MSDEYNAVVAKVDDFAARASALAGDDLVCGRGCAGCCAVWLTVNQVESAALRAALAALDSATRARVAERGALELERARVPGAAPRCAMLEEDGSCAVYAARPLVCRTQGFALRYPAGFIPEAAVRARSSSGEITHCPLNFTAHAPDPAGVLDAERVDQLLALVNVRFARAHGLDPEERVALSALATRSV